jgi:radical SAM protein with 4Fe4S-binding SPASM domain
MGQTDDNTMQAKADPPFLIALNLTLRCNLACDHCYLDAKILKEGSTDELATEEVKSVLGDIAALSPECMVVLTGGEPLLRRDIEELAAHASALGLMVVIGSNGLTLTPKRVESLKCAGVAGIGISLDSLTPSKHDVFRGRKGAWDKTMAAIDACVAGGLAFQLHFSVTDDTADEIDDMVAFARDAGAMVLNVFFLVCTGRGEKYTDISPDKYEQVLRRVAHAARNEQRLMVRAKCAPHFKRIAMEIDPGWPITTAHGYDAGGCLAATRYARITPEGNVTPCPFMETSVGSVRDTPFAEIWQDAPMLKAMRAPKLEGRCGICEFQKLCGGCRARPLARDGNLMGEDFLCNYQPGGGAVIEPLVQKSDTLDWTDEAKTRIARVPGFVRRMVRQRAEAYVRGEGRVEVTADDLATLAKRRFGDAGPPRFNGGPDVGGGGK